MTYVLTVNNSGTANATNIRVVDTLPAGVRLRSAIGHKPVRLHVGRPRRSR